MRNYKKMFIGLIVLVNILLAIGIYTNYQLNHRGMRSNPEMVSTDNGEHQPAGEDSPSSDSNPGSNDMESSESKSKQPWWSNLLSRLTHSDADNPAKDNPSNQDMLKLAEKQLGQPVDKSDVAKVAAILIKRLDSEELSFIYEQMTQEGKPSSANIKKAKQILQNKLTSEELELVQDVALKYGKKINF